MKEKIYTIPVNEAFDKDCECPLCYLHKNLENDALEYALGAAMMEPDYRLLSNDKGYCNKHFSMLFSKPNKLSLSLVLDTHLNEMRKKFALLSSEINSLKNEKGGLFKKSSSTSLKNICDTISDCESSCVICDKVNRTIDRYIEIFFYLLKNDPDFLEKVKTSKGFCIPHFKELCTKAFKYLSHEKAQDFVEMLYAKECAELERIQNDIHRFTLKFDYRNRDMEWGSAIDAPIRTIEKISGHISTSDKNEQE